jgi:hypothetical protein
MATNSFLFKGWAITIAAGIAAFAAVNSKAALLAIAVVSTLLFWALDGYYLWLEREFIKLYEKVSATDPSDIDFAMRPAKQKPITNWLKACKRPHIVVFYGVAVAAECVGVLFIGSK